MSANFNPAMSTDEICVGTNSNLCLSDYLDKLESDVSGKAASDHSHTDLENAIEGLEDGKAETVHTHEISDINGLNAALTELEEAISTIQNGGGSAGVAPVLVATMHLGKLDNNSGAENSSSTRICSDPFAVEPGKSYYQVNDKGVNMYVLIYDADELFLGYLGSFASGAAIPVTNPNAAYMRLGSLLGEYDLSNEFRIYDTDPASGGDTGMEVYTCVEADARFAPKDHSHANDHTHDNKAVLDGITAEKVAAWDAGTGSGSGYVHPSTHPASMIEGLSAVATSGNYEDLENKPTIPVIPTALPANGGNADTVGGKSASEFATSGHTHTPASIGAAAASHSHDYAASNHTHHPANIGALPSSGGTISGALTVMLDSIFNGVLNTQKIQPKDTGSYSIGTADNRYYSTYLKVNPNVSSDRRCKRDIAALNVDTLAEFVNALSVVSYNYTDDAEDEAKRIGVVAQDVISVAPGLAQFFIEQDNKGFYSLRPADFVFPLIAAVQVLSRKVAELEANR